MTYDDRWEDEDREVSIHIPRVGDDVLYSHMSSATMQVSIHIPRVGDDERAKRIAEIIAVSIHIPRVGDDT